MLIKNFIAALGPFLVAAAMLGGIWWYVVIHPQAAVEALPEGLQPLGNPDLVQAPEAPAEAGPPLSFYVWFWLISAAIALVILRYYARMTAERFEVLKLLTSSVMPLGILTVVVLAVILFGITTATESAAVGAAGAFLLAVQARTLDWKRTKEAVFLTAKTTAMVRRCSPAFLQFSAVRGCWRNGCCPST
jgi:TRAP-type mannitol/chloroaromatic compound transport system permease large subunit